MGFHCKSLRIITGYSLILNRSPIVDYCCMPAGFCWHNAHFLAYTFFQKLSLIAVEESLRYLQPPWDQGEPGLCKWLGKVYQVQSAVESVLISQQDKSLVQNRRFTYKITFLCYHL